MIRSAKTAVAWLICAAAMAMVGCSTAYDAAQQSRGAISQGLDQATEAWGKYDRAKQLRIASDAPTKPEAVAALKAYRDGEQAAAVKGINGTWAAVVSLDASLAAWKAGSKGGLAPALAAAYARLAEVVAALTAAGVPIPGGGGR